MEALWLKISNFKSFEGDHMIDFRDYGPGLYFMKGQNDDEEDLGSNGAGKSTIWDALHWCWFGTSVRGTPTTQLVPWTETGKPSVEFAFGGLGRGKSDITRIIRTHRPNTLTIQRGDSHKGATQDEVDDLLGLTSEAVQSSIIVGQYSRYFFDLKPVEKMKLLTDLLELDYWIECSIKARDTLYTLREDKHGLETKLAGKVAVRDRLRLDLKRLKEDPRVGLGGAEVEGMQLILQIQIEERKKLKGRLLAQTRRLEDAESRIDSLREDRRKWEAKIDEHHDIQQGINYQLRDIKKNIEDMRRKVATLKTTKFGRDAYKCPACDQPVSDAHRKKHIRTIETVIRDLMDQQKELLEKHAKESHREDKAAQEALKFKTAIQAIDMRDLERKIGKTNTALAEVRKDIEATKVKIADMHKERMRHQEKLSEVRGSLSRRKADIKQIESGIRELETAMEQASYWVKAFKDIRLFEINDVLTSLEVEVNSYLADLGMPGWSVSFEIERSTRKGTVSRGFRVMVDPGVGSKGGTKPWEAWSGGEGQRLRSAGTLALANLILRQHNRTCNFQVLDEKLYWLSGQGETDMLELLRDIAIAEGKQIWVIDQHNLDYPFDGYVTVVKDSEGSRIVQ